jgi:hypothetical protein
MDLATRKGVSAIALMFTDIRVLLMLPFVSYFI